MTSSWNHRVLWMFCDAAVLGCVGLAFNFLVSDGPRSWVMRSLIRCRRNKLVELYQIDFQVPCLWCSNAVECAKFASGQAPQAPPEKPFSKTDFHVDEQSYFYLASDHWQILICGAVIYHGQSPCWGLSYFSHLAFNLAVSASSSEPRQLGFEN